MLDDHSATALTFTDWIVGLSDGINVYLVYSENFLENNLVYATFLVYLYSYTRVLGF